MDVLTTVAFMYPYPVARYLLESESRVRHNLIEVVATHSLEKREFEQFFEYDS